jgi:hypothetical protein
MKKSNRIGHYARPAYKFGECSKMGETVFLSCIIPEKATLQVTVHHPDGSVVLQSEFPVKDYGDTFTFDTGGWEPGDYRVVIEVGSHTFERILTIEKKPNIWERLFNLQ